MKSCVIFELRGNLHVGGFLPFFWKITAEAGLAGWISNSQDGVLLDLEGTDEQISSFIRSLPYQVPGAFRLNTVTVLQRKSGLSADQCLSNFRVRTEGLPIGKIAPDHAPCQQCIDEMLDPKSRRFLYPFTACKDCGPQYAYALRSPFARKNTALTAFPVCSRCQSDKDNPSDMHHHGSELLACKECGPQFFLLDMYGDLVSDELPIRLTRQAISEGCIVAIQSLYGGFQICTDAFMPESIQRLRRKRKLMDRPLSLMARNIEVVRRYCECSGKEAELLESPEAPVVILQKKRDCSPWQPLPDNISPDTDTLAVTLPPSLPEKLLFELPGEFAKPLDLLVVCGDNRPGKAECLDVDEIFNRLMSFTDRFLCHDLKTSHACPQSILQIRENAPMFMRRARGYAPDGAGLPQPLKSVVGAFGCDSQAAVALGIDTQIHLSQSLGAIDGPFETSILNDLFERFTYLFDRVPDIMACDMNRDSFSAQACSAYAELHDLPLMTIQTHHAHALACMAEHHLEHVLAVVLNNGSGGPDGLEWGAECLEARLDGFSRLASYKPCSKENSRPARLFLERLNELSIQPSQSLLDRIGVVPQEFEMWKRQSSGTKPLTHSALRVINTICAGLGIAPDFCTYTDRCLLILRKYASRYIENTPISTEISGLFRFSFTEGNDFRQIDWSETWRNLSTLPVISEEEKPLYARAVYDALARSVITMCEYAGKKTGLNDLVLSGSVFQDPILLSTAQHQLERLGFHVYTHTLTACDESCVPLGQAYAAGLSQC